MTFVVKSNFFGNFKTGDNVVYNLEILNYFYDLYNSGNPRIKALLIKPIVIWLMSIIEAVLHDFYGRIKYHTFEGVINIPKLVIKYIIKKLTNWANIFSMPRRMIFLMQRILDFILF
jgi:hypothetical protein